MMIMNKTIMVGFLLIAACLFQAAIFPCMANTSCGLKNGQYAKYDWSITVSDGSASYSQSGTLNVNIQSVSGTGYSGNAAWTISTGNLPTAYNMFLTPTGTQSFSGDVATNSGGTAFISLLAIPANDSTSDTSLNIGNLTQGNYKGRNAIMADSSMFGLGMNRYYDQTTGIIMYQEETMNMGTVSYDVKLQMTDTNMWTSNNNFHFTWIIAVAVIIVVAVAVGAAVLIRKKKPPPEQPTATPSPPSNNPPP